MKIFNFVVNIMEKYCTEMFISLIKTSYDILFFFCYQNNKSAVLKRFSPADFQSVFPYFPSKVELQYECRSD